MIGGLHVNNLSHAFGEEKVVNGVSVFVAPGEVVCLLGPSGCGKTTLLRVAAGLERLQKGQIRIGETMVGDGTTGLHVPPNQRGIGLMFQDYALFPHLNVRENISFGVGADTPARRAWAETSLEQMGLRRHGESYPHTLSGGQQQRVALLRALATEPSVLLLDEPFSGLDIARRAAVRGQSLDMLRDTDVATFLVTHDPEEAMFMADRILVMNNGRVVQDGSPEQIYFRPDTEFVADLFGTVNRLTGTVVDGVLATAIGTFDARHLDSGTLAQVLVRPEAFRLAFVGETPAPHPGDAPYRSAPMEVPRSNLGVAVTGARSLGRASLVTFVVPTDKGDVELEARVPGIFVPEPGSQITVTVNAAQAHVFPVDDNG